MQYNKLGTTDINVSQICLGTMTFGEQCSKDVSNNIMNYAFEKGINFLDTSEMYPVFPKKETQGKSEEFIGEWIKEKKIRNKVIIATKITSNHPKIIGSTKLTWLRKGGPTLRFNKENMNKAIDDSLKRLRTDYIDLYQLHSPERKVAVFGELDFKYDPNDNDWTPIEEVLDNLNNLVKLGKIRHVGLSNETPWGILNFLQISKQKNLPRVMSVQNGYSLVNRVFDIANSEVSIKEKCGLLAYSPLAGGRLSGKYLNGKHSKNSRFALWPKRFARNNTKRGEVAIKKYVKLAEKYNIQPSTLAHAFVFSRPFVTSNVIGVTTKEQLDENITSSKFNLTKEIIDEIENIHLSDPNPCV